MLTPKYYIIPTITAMRFKTRIGSWFIVELKWLRFYKKMDLGRSRVVRKFLRE